MTNLSKTIMKKVRLIILLAVLISMVNTKAFAYDIAVANDDGVTIYYNYINNGTELMVTYKFNYDSYSGTVNIPKIVTYNGTTYSVTSIGNDAFNKCSGLTSITIPNSVTTIGYDAFSGCSSLTTISIPNSVTSIANSAFWFCSGLTSITVGSGNAVYDSRNACNAIIETASNILITGCMNTTIPNSVTSIGACAFASCSSLTSIAIPNSVTSIGYDAFDGCSSLASILIPNSVKSIGEQAFRNCPTLTSITVESGNAVYDSRNACNAIIETASNTLITGCKNTTIPNSVTSIGNYAFEYCSSLTSITIPNSVTSIGGEAFAYCTGLISITIPNSVMNIGAGAFYGTAWYDNQPDGLVYVGRVAYTYKGKMLANTNITLEEGTLWIANGAFSGCTGLTTITIPNSVKNIGSYAFSQCSGLTSISMGNGVTIIGESAFYGCSSLISVTIPQSVTTIGSEAFEWCTNLRSVIIPNSVASIGSYAFSGTAWYNNQPDGLVYAGKVAYSYKGTMPANTNITLEEGTLGISGYAFFRCSGLTSISIPNSVKNIGEGTFNGCTGLTSISIPNSVKNIGKGTFNGCTGLTSIIIPNSVTCIGDFTFNNCTGLTSITIPNSVTSIGNAAFSSCSSLTSVTIPNSVTSIGDFAFSSCSSLTSITIGSGVNYIGSLAFAYCSNRTDVYCYAENIPNTNTDAFDGSYPEKATLHVPDASLQAYKTTDPWSSFGMIAGLSTEINPIENGDTTPVLIQNNGGTLTIQGVADGTLISVYTTAGIQAGTTVSQNSHATISTSMQQGDIAIIKIGERNIKFLLK